MQAEFDFTAYDKQGQLELVVEVKARRGIDNMWARDLRANIAERLEHELPTLLVVTPKAIYAWNRGTHVEDLPDYEALSESDQNPLHPYFLRAGVSGDDFIEPEVFRLIVAQWLDDVAAGDPRAHGHLGNIEQVLKGLHGGRIVREAA